MDRRGIIPFIVAAVVWTYVFSAVFAQQFWGAVFERAIVSLDLAPNQCWFVPFVAGLAFAAIAVPSAIKYLLLLRRGSALSVGQHVAQSLCLAGACLCVLVTKQFLFTGHRQLFPAFRGGLNGNAQSIFSAGRLGDGSYSNALVGLSIRFPGGWYPMSLNSMQRAKQSVAKAVLGKDTEQARALAAAQQGIYPLLAVHKFPESYGGYNPSLVVEAYEKRSVAAKGLRNLDDYANSFLAVRGPYHAKSGPAKEAVGSFNGYYIRIEGHFPKGTLLQDVYLAETDSLYIMLVASALEDPDLATLKEAVSTVHIERR